MKVTTTRFGEIEVNEDLVINFEGPIIGYDHLKRYLIIDQSETSCFKWLQSVDDGSMAFPVTTASYFNIDYNFEITDEDAEKIGLNSVEDLIVLNIATVPGNQPMKTTINLKAPIIASFSARKAMQIILPDDKYPIKYPLFGNKAPTPPKKED